MSILIWKMLLGLHSSFPDCKVLYLHNYTVWRRLTWPSRYSLPCELWFRMDLLAVTNVSRGSFLHIHTSSPWWWSWSPKRRIL
jgi:hypothetical protein